MQSSDGYKFKHKLKVETADKKRITQDTEFYQQRREKLTLWYDIILSFGENRMEK
jgi:hypothetical protein